MAFRDIIVVRVPLPAIIGKAIGTTAPECAFLSPLKISWPNTISNPNKNITIEPPTANDFTSKPNTCKKGFPKNKNKIISTPDISVTLSDLMAPDFSFMAINSGIEPTISITANKVKITVSN